MSAKRDFGAIVDVRSEKELDDLLTTSGKVAVYFFAKWAAPCTQMNSVFEALQEETSSMIFVRVDGEKQTGLTKRHGIKTVPTFIIYGNERVVRKVEGADAPSLSRAVKWVSEATDDMLLTAACEYLVQRSRVVLLIKGMASSPRCPFCKRAVERLRMAGVVFDAYDVLQDSAVRDRVKEVARWETFPVLFAKGRLIGGIDTIDRLADERRLVAEVARGDGDPQSAPGADDALAPKLFESTVMDQNTAPILNAAGTKATAETPSPDSKATAAISANAVSEEKSPSALRSQLDDLVNRERIMLFMKGLPDEPRCRFSRRIIETLRSNDVPFGSFDILTDESVRQGLKTYAQWPTFPQVYADGRFIGGLDIINELASVGELHTELGL